ncbi:MAG: radical SAM protein [Thermoplasmata archaeon]
MELEYGKKEVEGVKVNITDCKTALSDSGLESDYALNPYRGCSHGCLYCYSPYVIKEERHWGDFLDVKRNIPRVLAKELKNKDRGVVRVGSVTDPYQKAEKQYSLTRKCLFQLKNKEFPVIVQTKSPIVKRDIDLYTEMNIDIGFTVTSLNEEFRSVFEPGAPPVSERLSAIRELNEEGIDTWVFIGPLLPYVNDSEEDLRRLKNTLESIGVEEIYLDKLNVRKGMWSDIKEQLDEDLIKKYKQIYFGDQDYFKKKKKIYNKYGKTVF